MSTVHVSRVKPTSKMRRYEYLRERGVLVETGGSHPLLLAGDELDAFIDRAIWIKAHPGKDPESTWEIADGVQGK